MAGSSKYVFLDQTGSDHDGSAAVAHERRAEAVDRRQSCDDHVGPHRAELMGPCGDSAVHEVSICVTLVAEFDEVGP